MMPVAAQQAREISELKGRSHVLTGVERFFSGEKYEWRTVTDSEGAEFVCYGYDWNNDAKVFAYPIPVRMVYQSQRLGWFSQHQPDPRAKTTRNN